MNIRQKEFKSNRRHEVLERLLWLILYDTKEIKLGRKLTLDERHEIQDFVHKNLPTYDDEREEINARFENPLDL